MHAEGSGLTTMPRPADGRGITVNLPSSGRRSLYHIFAYSNTVGRFSYHAGIPEPAAHELVTDAGRPPEMVYLRLRRRSLSVAAQVVCRLARSDACRRRRMLIYFTVYTISSPSAVLHRRRSVLSGLAG